MPHRCERYGDCENLPVQTYIWRTLEGPSIAVSDGTVPFTDDTGIAGLSSQLFLRLLYRAEAKLGPACVGPARSVLGLGPMERFTYATSHSRELDLGLLLRKTSEASNTIENSIRSAVEFVDSDTTTHVEGNTDSSGFSLGPFGSWDFSGESDSEFTETVISNTTTSLFDNITTTISSKSETTETEMTAGLTDITAQSTTRTLVNPYHDRSLMVRFFPVYREVHLTLKLTGVKPGVSIAGGKFARTPNLATHGDFLTAAVKDKNVLNLAVADLAQTPLTASRRGSGRQAAAQAQLDAHLKSNLGYYTAAYLHHVRRNVGPEPIAKLAGEALRKSKLVPAKGNALAGIDRDRITVSGDRILLPATSGEQLGKALRLPKEHKQELAKIDDEELVARQRELEITLHLFMGTHVEVVPGECVLPDLPELSPEA